MQSKNSTPRPAVTCLGCGRVFRLSAYHLVRGRGKYCHRACIPRRPLAERFWEKVHRPDDLFACWLWTAHVDRLGYGWIGAGGQEGVLVKAHRVSWELHYGPIPEGLCVLHRCDRPGCVNPAHLWLGTVAENNADRARKERTGSTKLSATKVREMRRRHAAGEGISALAREYGVHPETARQAIHGQTWRHVL